MPQDNQSELEKFFEGVGSDAPKAFEETPVVEEKDNAEQAQHPNRAQRRAVENASIRAQLQEEREARIAAEARAAALAEFNKKDGALDERLIKLYGDTENGRLAAQLTAELLSDVRQQAVEEAEAKYSQREQEATREQVEAEGTIDNELAALEEAYDVDLTSNTSAAQKTRSQLLDLVEKFSPKDREGNIIEYADFESAFETLQQTNKPVTNPRAKDFADRGLQKSGQANVAVEQEDATRSWLRRNGIRV